MLESILLGTAQGIAEWLPISSEGLVSFIEINFFANTDLVEIIKFSLFLHLGTFLAALIYFRSDILVLLKTLFRYKIASEQNKELLKFLLISTVISSVIGMFFLKVIGDLSGIGISGQLLTLAIGLMLLVTAYLGLKRTINDEGRKSVNLIDSVIAGIAQGFAAIPGLSRSGITVSVLLMRKIDENEALRLSFLMSLPIVLGGNIILNSSALTFNLNNLVALSFSFIFGLLTIHYLLKIARNVSFSYFALIFGLLMVFSIFIT